MNSYILFFIHQNQETTRNVRLEVQKHKTIRSNLLLHRLMAENKHSLKTTSKHKARRSNLLLHRVVMKNCLKTTPKHKARRSNLLLHRMVAEKKHSLKTTTKKLMKVKLFCNILNRFVSIY